MAKIIKDLVEYIGISDTLPANPLYFKEISIPETVTIPPQKPDIEQLLAVMIEPEIVSVRLIETPVGVSNESQNLSGCKLVMELRLHQKVKYVADEPCQSVHVAEFESVFKSIFVVIPCEVNGVKVCELMRKNKVIIKPYIEDIFAKMMDERTVFKNTTLFLNVTFKS